MIFSSPGGPWNHGVIQISALAVDVLSFVLQVYQYACRDRRSIFECTVANQTVVTQYRLATSCRKPQIGVLLTFGQV